ncbi:hypothetical protein OYA08_000679 [Escherichia coli O104]|nr:hypothetical protein [Escherichia coli]EKF4566691.1 hypothetical protein [Escherichia coli O104]EFI2703646.1 hypothetical protein [Escherichia coli]EFI2769489.1 hypothetical protein [Escherichia coli]EFI2788346.1 hypothetical protein [Escherichia coli]EFJ7246596.1 hypothetical protein [Escherichia coli]
MTFLIASIVIYLINPVYSGEKYGKSSDAGKNSKTVYTVFYIDDLKGIYKKSGISAAFRIVTAIFLACLRSSWMPDVQPYQYLQPDFWKPHGIPGNLLPVFLMGPSFCPPDRRLTKIHAEPSGPVAARRNCI